jgi:hypothetical protein
VNAGSGSSSGSGSGSNSGSGGSGDAAVDSTVAPAADGGTDSSGASDAAVDSTVAPAADGSALGDASDAGGIGAEGGDGGFAVPPTCDGSTGWRCAVDANCAPDGPTTLTGRVFDPAGENPLYNVFVFIPNDPGTLPAIAPGTSACNGTCGASIGDYVVAGQTDATGSFTLKNVPTGTGVPVTVQVGKWRRTTTVNIPTSCVTTKVSDGTLRLPARRSEGDLPQMALLTGGCDDLACFLTNIGLDPSEFTAPQGGGRLDVYAGVGGAGLTTGTAGACGAAGCPLWASRTSLEYYDIALFSCECGENTNTKPAAAMQALHDWLNEGGKVFASHFQYVWFKDNPQTDFQDIATWLGTSIAAGGGTYDINAASTFPKGQALADWLGDAGALASPGPPPTIDLNDVASSVSTVNATAQQWIYDSTTSPNDTKYLSFDTPIGGVAPPPLDAGPDAAGAYCGKAVFTDLHGGGGSLFATANPVPSGCGARKPLTAQQKALEFLFFDLSACVTSDTAAPPPPPPPH